MESRAASSEEITQLLHAWAGGDAEALERLVPVVFRELRRIAHHYMSREGPGQTIQSTALVHEAYLRLLNYRDISWKDRAHFFAVAARQMRHILTDIARARQQAKRGAGARPVSLDTVAELSEEKSAELLALDEALEELEKIDERKARVVELRHFGGLSLEETAKVLKVTTRTVLRDWETARAWLYQQLQGSAAHH